MEGITATKKRFFCRKKKMHRGNRKEKLAVERIPAEG